MTDLTSDFYDDLSDHYHLVYGKWDQAVVRQARALRGVSEKQIRKRPEDVTILDCTCGIGTQAIGLALEGYRVRGSDLSPRAVQRAEREARRLGASVAFSAADVRQLGEQVDGTFDVVISCDNAIPHLLSDEDLSHAVVNIKAKLKPSGTLLIGMKDHDRLVEDRPATTQVRVTNGPAGRAFVFQVWHWDDDGRAYDFEHVIVHEASEGWRTYVGKGRYRALLRGELEAILSAEGFRELTWHSPADTGYFEQMLTAVRG